MQVYPTPFAAAILLEANKFWLYALLSSLAISTLQLYSLSTTPAPTPTSKTLVSEEEVPPTAPATTPVAAKTLTYQKIVSHIIADACDCLIPGAITGWFPTSFATVGMTSVVSSLLAAGDIWERVQKV